MARLVTFLLPEGEHLELARMRPRNPDNMARDIVRATLARQRRRIQRIAAQKEFRKNADALREQQASGTDQRARNAGT